MRKVSFVVVAVLVVIIVIIVGRVFIAVPAAPVTKTMVTPTMFLRDDGPSLRLCLGALRVRSSLN